MPRAHWLATDPDLWRRRAVRLLLVYLVLALTLLTARFLTRQIRPELLGARQQEKMLIQERDTRDLRTQSLLSDARIQTWALQNGMVRFVEAPKTSRDLGAQPLLPKVQVPPEPLKVNIQWN